MTGISINNSKFKNTGVLYEIVVRLITKDILENKSSSEALGILKEYFNINTQLGQELQLYQAIVNSNRLSEGRALDYLHLILSQRKKLNERTLLEEKYKLISKLKQHYELDELLKTKLPLYKVYASIYKTFLSESLSQTHQIVNIRDVAEAKFYIIEHLLGYNAKDLSQNQLLEEFKNQTEDLRILTYQILIDRFNTKYSSLCEEQQQLLRAYIYNISNTSTLSTYVGSQIPILESKLKIQADAVQDPVLQIKLHEVIKNLSSIKTNEECSIDTKISLLMLAYEIERHMRSLNDA